MRKTKVLEVCAALDIGGAQAVGANIAKFSDDSFYFCYLVFGDEVGEYEADIIARGNTVLHWPAPSNNFLRFLSDLVKLMRREKFDAVHCHTMFNCGIMMLAAKIAGVPGRISHSHTIKEECNETLIRKAYRWFMRKLIHLCGNEFLACGVEAGNVLYGEKWFTRKGKVIPNGIDTAQYRFSGENREKIRRLYGVEDQTVIGHVGHYVGVKNQTFLISLMQRIRRLHPQTTLLLFGEGEDRAKLEEEIKQQGVQDCVRLMGNVSNIGQVLSAFDVFVFPSLFEGTPLALIEAQANGLPCIISDAIPVDACLTEDIKRLSLSEEPEQWVEAIVSAKRVDSEDKTELLLRKYEDVRDSMDRLYEIFRKYREGK